MRNGTRSNKVTCAGGTAEPDSANGRKELDNSEKEPQENAENDVASRASEPGTELDFPVVGVGASAGGLNALQEFLSGLPDYVEAAFVVIQHLDPHHTSHMAGILAKKTDMEVAEPEDDTPVEPAHIYTIPSNNYLEILDGRLRLRQISQESSRRMPVDVFFRSLAQDQHENAIGIVLSGSGSDGTLGMREIQGAGGMTMAQDPASAEYDSMPRSAISTDAVDYVLPCRELAEALVDYMNRMPCLEGTQEKQEAGETAIERILNIVAVRTDRNFSSYKRNTIRRRIERRMGINGIEDIWDYVQKLRQDPKEVDELAREMLVCVTSFFREPQAFETLRTRVVQPLVDERGQDDTIRVWCPGCATGEEAYSLVILFREEMERQDKSCSLQIFASDVESSVLDTGRRGVYPESISADVSEQRLERFFTKTNGSYRVIDPLQEQILFAEHDLLRDPPFSNLDCVSCRNVLIYLRPDAQKKVLGLMAFALDPDGYLFLGKSDALTEGDTFFDTEDSEARIFRRNRTPSTEALQIPSPTSSSDVERTTPTQPAHGYEPNKLTNLNQWILLQHFSAATVLVRPDGEVVHFFGHTERYLQHPTGAASLSLVELTRDTIPVDLAQALEQVRKEREAVCFEDVQLQKENLQARVDITVRPMPQSYQNEDLVAVIFERSRRASEEAERSETADYQEIQTSEQDRVSQLREKLEQTRRDYQATVEELETSNEELRAANEEVTSMNEELQSTNEELQSSKEELQSMNEELNTLNDQLNETVRELRKANSDLENLFRGIKIPVIFLDRNLCIKRIAPTTGRIFNVAAQDVGRPLTDITHKLVDEDPAADAQQVLRDLNSFEKEVWDDDGACYLMRVIPYRSCEDQIEGVVITFSDITQQKETERKLKELNRTLEQKVEERTAELQERSRRLQRMANRLADTEERERQKLAEILHDNVKQLLVVAKMKLGKQMKNAAQDETQAGLEELRDVLEQAIQETDTLTAGLCPTILYEDGLVPALKWLKDWTNRQYGLTVNLETDPNIEPEQRTRKAMLFQAAQELLANVARHAGTDSADLHLGWNESAGDFRLVVEDEGCGFSPDAVLDGDRDEQGFGLFHLRQRLDLLGGDMTIESRPEQGTKVTITLPPEDSGEQVSKS